jgi:hypothetical protein
VVDEVGQWGSQRVLWGAGFGVSREERQTRLMCRSSYRQIINSKGQAGVDVLMNLYCCAGHRSARLVRQATGRHSITHLICSGVHCTKHVRVYVSAQKGY